MNPITFRHLIELNDSANFKSFLRERNDPKSNNEYKLSDFGF